MINNFKDFEKLFHDINELAKIRLNLYIIGGAVLLYRELKPATKDIDVVLNSQKEYDELHRVLKELGFMPDTKKIGYKHLNLEIILKKDNFQVDLFMKQVCSKFSYSLDMIERSEKVFSHDRVKVHLSSNEDVFAFKTMTDRDGDIDDCIALAKRTLDWNAILKEIQNQINVSGNNIWITWINERLELLEDKKVVVPIIKTTSKLTIEYYEQLKKTSVH